MDFNNSKVKIHGTHVAHEVLLALFGSKSCFDANHLGIKDLLHPSEGMLLSKILEVASEGDKLKHFIAKVNCQQLDEESSAQYLPTFVDHLKHTLHPYYDTVISLESELLHGSTTPLLSLEIIWAKIGKYSELLVGLNKLVKEIEYQKSKGCLILQHLNERLSSEVGAVKIAVEYIIRNVNTMFMSHIVHWLVYGELERENDEFFIHKNPACGPEATPFDEYILHVDMLPRHVGIPLARRILSVGQTVRFLRRNLSATTGNLGNKTFVDCGGISEEKRQQIVKMAADLEGMTTWDEGGVVEKLVTEASAFVTRQLWTEAVHGAKLAEQLRAIKDFYLLGKGELFHTFIGQLGHRRPYSETKYREINQILQECARKVCLKEESLQRFTMEMTKGPDGTDMWDRLSLRYEVPPPLQLIFTTPVLATYNNLFRFLLWLKRIDIRMVGAWLCEKGNRTSDLNRKSRHLQRKLRFLLSNLQYYMHVNVLDSQFMLLELAVARSTTFEEVHKAHAIFLSNVLSQTFLPDTESQVTGHKTGKRIYDCVNQILVLCEEFCLEVEVMENGELEDEQVEELTLKLDASMTQLLKLLAHDANNPTTQGLAELLLRLNFNRYFSNQYFQI